MRIPRLIIPRETDADVAMAVIIPCVNERTGGEVSYSYEFEGVSDRTAYGDVLSVNIKNKKNSNPSVKFSLKRDSIYHILPEFLFHPIDRYSGTNGDVAEFEKRYEEQEEQERNALTYFKFFDHRYQELKVKHQLWLNENIFRGNLFLSDYVTSAYPFNRENTYINAVLPCIPWLRNYRGNKEMIEVAIRYAFAGNASVEYHWKNCSKELDESIHSSLDGMLDDMYCGSTFQTGSYMWIVHYQTKIETEIKLEEQKIAVMEFSDFFKKWFLNVEDDFSVEFGDWQAAPVLSDKDDLNGIFLNYSTQLM